MSRSKVYPGEPRNRSLSLAETNLDITVVTSAEMDAGSSGLSG